MTTCYLKHDIVTAIVFQKDKLCVCLWFAMFGEFFLSVFCIVFGILQRQKTKKPNIEYHKVLIVFCFFFLLNILLSFDAISILFNKIYPFLSLELLKTSSFLSSIGPL